MIASETQLGQDFWDPSILASTNWLGTIDLDGFDLITPNLSAHAQANQYSANGLQWSGSPFSVPSSTPAVSVGTSAQVSAAQFPTDDLEAQERSGLHYLDGEPTRQPRTKRRKTHGSTPAAPRSDSEFDLSQPETSVYNNSTAISQHIYAQLKDAYHRYCLSPSLTWNAFAAADFPSKLFFEELLSLSRDKFRPSLPLVHVSSFTLDKLHWVNAAEIAALGSHYMESEHKYIFIVSMHEFVRRIVCHLVGNPAHSPTFDRVEQCQILLLHYVGVTYCGDARLLRQTASSRQSLNDVFQIATQEFCRLSDENHARQGIDTDHKLWQTWLRKETTIRLAYSAWLLDCMWAYHYQCRSMLQLCDGTLPLPCHERLWNAGTAEEWTAAKHGRDEASLNNISLVKAMAELYIDKTLPQDRGEFARVLMIHALFQRLWEVERSLENPLSWWEPSVQRQQSATILPQEPVWLPSVPSYVAWQNTSCDALDILHWQANATIGQASGMEHSTVLHLHLARVILLVPCEALVRLAQALSGIQLDGHMRTSLGESGRPMESSEAKTLSRWATAHQYKARLAAIHAGVVFWHVRRYSTDAFYEAPAVALAALTLWAFGVFAKQQRSPSGITSDTTQAQASVPAATTCTDRLRGTTDASNEDGMCDIILLDRPTDDELVQHFIKHGNRMQAHISGVGDLYNTASPALVLKQGCRLLDELEQCWGVARGWNELLCSLSSAWAAPDREREQRRTEPCI